MVLSAGPEWQELVQGPWEVVAGVGVDSLEQSQDDPQTQCEEVQLTGVHDVEDWHTDGTETEGHGLSWVGVLGRETEWSGVSVVLLVDVLVEDSVVEESVGPVVPHVLEDEEQADLEGHGL